MEPDNVRFEICVSTLECPNGTVIDATGLACTKIAPVGIVEKGDICDITYTEWVPGYCYINCPSTFLENTTECRKPVYVRRTAAATADITGYVFLVVLLGLLMYTYYFKRRL